MLAASAIPGPCARETSCGRHPRRASQARLGRILPPLPSLLACAASPLACVACLSLLAGVGHCSLAPPGVVTADPARRRAARQTTQGQWLVSNARRQPEEKAGSRGCAPLAIRHHGDCPADSANAGSRTTRRSRRGIKPEGSKPGPRGPRGGAARHGPRAGEIPAAAPRARGADSAERRRPPPRWSRRGIGGSEPGPRAQEAERAARRGDPRRRRSALVERNGDGPARGPMANGIKPGSEGWSDFLGSGRLRP